MISALKGRTAVPLGWAVLVVGLAFGGVACTDTEAAPPAAPGTYAVGVREPASLFPAEVRDLAGRMITGALWTPLMSYDAEKRQAVPLAAASVTSPDKLVWTVKLRPGMRFHDGTPVTARSYIGTWQAAVRERWRGAAVLTDVLRAKDMRAADDTTIELTLDRPFAQAPVVLGAPALYPLPDSVLGSKDWAGFAANPIGNGPYRMAEPWRGGSGSRLLRFDGYQGGAPGKASEIALRVVDDAGAQYEQVRKGTLDVATAVPGAGHDAMLREFSGRHLIWPLPEVTHLGFPLRDKRFQDPTVRHAFALAVDRATLEAGPLDRQVDPARSLLPPSVALPQRSGPCRPCNYDPAAATSLLGQVDGVTGPVTVYHEAGQEPWVRPLVEQLSHTLGLEVAARPLAAGQPRDSLDGPFIVTRALSSVSPREPMTGIAGYANAGFDDLLASADASDNPEESGQLYRLAENQLLRDLPLVPLWSAHGHAVWTERVRVGRADPVRDLDLATVEVP